MNLALVQQLFAGTAVVAGMEPTVHGTDRLLAEELSWVISATPQRQREFASGRVLLRRLLRELGCVDPAVAVGPRGRPLLPAGIVGSLAHTDSLCVAAVASSAHVAAIGIDVESLGDSSEELVALIATPAERRWLEGGALATRAVRARMLFSAKESFFKCQCDPQQPALLHTDLEITFASACNAFTAHRRGPVAAGVVQCATGRVAITDACVVTAIAVSAPSMT